MIRVYHCERHTASGFSGLRWIRDVNGLRRRRGVGSPPPAKVVRAELVPSNGYGTRRHHLPASSQVLGWPPTAFMMCCCRPHATQRWRRPTEDIRNAFRTLYLLAALLRHPPAQSDIPKILYPRSESVTQTASGLWLVKISVSEKLVLPASTGHNSKQRIPLPILHLPVPWMLAVVPV